MFSAKLCNVNCKLTKIMPKYTQSKRSPSEVAGTVSKKRRTGSISAQMVKSVDVKSESGIRKSSRVWSLRSAGIKQEEKDIKEEDTEEEAEEEEAGLPGNQGSDEEEDVSDEDNDLSAYEKKRLRNIQENKQFFASLGILKIRKPSGPLDMRPTNNGKDAEENLASSLVKTFANLSNSPKPVAPVKSKDLIALTKTVQIMKLIPEHVAKVTKDRIYALAVHPSKSKIVICAGDKWGRLGVWDVIRKPSGPLDMRPTNNGKDAEENLASSLVKTFANLSNSPKPVAPVKSKDLIALTKTVQIMKLIPEHVAKVTKDRIYALAVHPSKSKIVICAGDKWGRLGVWDVDSKDGDDGVYLFEPHSQSISCLQFAPSNPAKLYSCSYDGTIRCGDFERGIFDEVFSTNIDDDIYCSHFDFLGPGGAKLLVSQNYLRQGHVQVVDSRLRCHQSSRGFLLQNRLLKTVHVRPTNSDHFVTACSDGTVALWDLRTLKEHGKSKCISSMSYGRSVSSAYFSPVTGRQIATTSFDDRIRILTVEESGKLEVKTSIVHDNHVGQWLTNFRTVWYPRREDALIVGSMMRPRRIKLYSDGGSLLHSLQDLDSLGSVCCINACHPTRDIIVGANSSGKIHVFM